jgi:hypothetical protein
MTTLTQKDKLRNAFTNGQELTAKQITARFKIASPSKVVSLLRHEDKMPVMTKRITNSKGQEVFKYTLAAKSTRRTAATA